MTKYKSRTYQAIRIIDVAWIMPICIAAAVLGKGLPMWLRISLFMIGISTGFFNAKNFIEVEMDKERKY